MFAKIYNECLIAADSGLLSIIFCPQYHMLVSDACFKGIVIVLCCAYCQPSRGYGMLCCFASSLLGRCARFCKWESSDHCRLLNVHSLRLMQPQLATLPAVEVRLKCVAASIQYTRDNDSVTTEGHQLLAITCKTLCKIVSMGSAC